ncbi:hypothetical protein RU96_GL001404 [Enterococcus canintestini]|uniref:Uncharacterized protein n=1 Tax=Enterococcus canintestini TaxID=317010 RepID=A0A1L8R2V2_9ENTE|nr:hypothetical protein RU96_GL001404 [Enterococcus canintestini]
MAKNCLKRKGIQLLIFAQSIVPVYPLFRKKKLLESFSERK